MAKNPIVDRLRAVLAEANITKSQVQHRGKHPKLFFVHDGEDKFISFSASPSVMDHAVQNAERDLRRMLDLPKESTKNPEARASRKAVKSNVSPGKPPELAPSEFVDTREDMQEQLASIEIKIAKPGIYEITNERYHADPCVEHSLSSSGARQILSECPSRYLYDREHPKDSTKALTFGQAQHTLLFYGREAFDAEFAVKPTDLNLSTKAGKAWKEEQQEAGRVILGTEEGEMLQAMAMALEAHPFAGKAFTNGKAEQSLFWQDETFGIWRRARLDWLPNAGVIFADYKTTRSASREALERAMFDYGYHQQADWYMSGIKALGICENPAFIFVFQEKEPPYEIVVAKPSDDALAWARIQNDKAMDIFSRCLESGQWPGYEADPIMLDLPGWGARRLEERHEAGAYEIGMRYHAPIEIEGENDG